MTTSIGRDGKPLKEPAPPCPVCTRRTNRECSHVDCTNRHAVTAGPPDNAWNFPECGARTLPIFERGYE